VAHTVWSVVLLAFVYARKLIGIESKRNFAPPGNGASLFATPDLLFGIVPKRVAYRIEDVSFIQVSMTNALNLRATAVLAQLRHRPAARSHHLACSDPHHAPLRLPAVVEDKECHPVQSDLHGPLKRRRTLCSGVVAGYGVRRLCRSSHSSPVCAEITISSRYRKSRQDGSSSGATARRWTRHPYHTKHRNGVGHHFWHSEVTLSRTSRLGRGGRTTRYRIRSRRLLREVLVASHEASTS